MDTPETAATYLRDSLANLISAAKEFQQELKEIRNEGDIENTHPDWAERNAFKVFDRAETVKRAAEQLSRALGGGK
jgi:hypothetical protein